MKVTGCKRKKKHIQKQKKKLIRIFSEERESEKMQENYFEGFVYK